MQIQYIGYRVKGLYRVAKLSSLATGMSQEVEARLKILRHWERYGLSSAIDAFGKSRSTLYSWRKQLRSAGGNTASLKPASRSPHRKRKPQWDPRLVKEIKRLRTVQANLGKDKLYAMLLPFCKPLGINPPSTSTIGRIIARTPDKMRTAPVRLTTKGKRKTIHRTPVSRKPKNLKLSACECLAYDTIVRQRDGVKRHILTAIDPIVHLAFAYAPPSAASQHAASLHQAISTTFEDFKDAKALTDNGSEFKGKFSKSLQQKGIQHWHTYPKSPKMNAHCERFNRSIQESFVDYHEDLLFIDLNLFNQKMSEWIVFYNTQLPHLATKPFPKKSASKTIYPLHPCNTSFLFNLRPVGIGLIHMFAFFNSLL